MRMMGPDSWVYGYDDGAWWCSPMTTSSPGIGQPYVHTGILGTIRPGHIYNLERLTSARLEARRP